MVDPSVSTCAGRYETIVPDDSQWPVILMLIEMSNAKKTLFEVRKAAKSAFFYPVCEFSLHFIRLFARH